ncbi:MAG TPA: (2Fe-2S)-binding protein [Armatimonadetes bacterium]|nr:(2Fe-2S)-binding protein [Armatimonadota bacterium]
MEVNGQPIEARPGQTVAAALVAAGIRAFRRSPTGQPRGPFCGMGMCFECLVTVDGQPNVHACLTPARPGMKIITAGQA